MTTVRDLPVVDDQGRPAPQRVCETPTEWVDETIVGMGGVRPCSIPTTRAVYDDVEDLHPDDPARWHTIHPICELHEISLYLKDVDADVRG